MEQNRMTRRVLGAVLALACCCAMAQPTVRIDATKTHQQVTGFGGFVCSPQFTYNHMSNSEIEKVWGKSSSVGCNIMRLYIPIGRSSWGQSLNTAKKAKQMGLIVFASPWGQPAEWKTNGTSNAKNQDGTTGKLKRENWADYAQYLEDYVQYLRQNGVELDAISIQNEPDWPAEYAGCLWDASEIAEFVKTYGKSISCKVMAPETLAVSDSYANALNSNEVAECFDIYGGHQYGGIQSAYKKLAAKGKQIWMTEYLINWNENQSTSRNFDFSKDFFNFFTAINTCMLGDFNAWIHYAAKRYYGMLGDGQNGTTNGSVTKRGYVMAHFARFITGMTRIDIDFGTTGLEGSAYISQSGDTLVAVMANRSEESLPIIIDLPFYTQEGKTYSTTKTRSMATTTMTLQEENCRQVVTAPALSVNTVMFIRSRDRQPSNMKGDMVRFDRIEDMKATTTGFGTAYKISGKTKTFDHNNPLFSSRTDANNGYIALDDRYSRLVIEVKNVTSTMNFSSAKTTLYYVNSAGKVANHDYGDLNLDRRENFYLVFDLSPATLPDGCKGILSVTNNNWSSTLTLTLGNITFDHGSGSPYAATLSGAYVEDDSYVLEYTHDSQCTSLNMSLVTSIPTTLPWLQTSNRIAYLPTAATVDTDNTVIDGQCQHLTLSTDAGDFRPLNPFNAVSATLTTNIEGCRLLMLPFSASVPQDVRAFSVNDDLSLTEINTIPAHTPALVVANGTVTFSGEGEITFTKSPIGNKLRGTYTASSLFAGDYVLSQDNGQWGFLRLEAPASLLPFEAYMTNFSETAFIPLQLDFLGIAAATTDSLSSEATYDLTGRRVTTKTLKPGVYIINGKKVLVK